MSLYLVIDAGGTKTRCRFADEARVLGEATGETVKLMSVGQDVATQRLQELVRAAATSAGVALDSVERTCIGLAGSSSSVARAWAETTLRALVSGEILLAGDEEIALDAAFRDGPGILVIAGTGSNAIGRCGNGKIVSAGGWGPMLGDEGSGHWIGLEALRAALRAQDRGIDTCLLREIMAFWKMADLGDLVAKGNQRARPEFAELTKIVVHCAERSDALAVSVLERAGEELAAQVRLVMSKMRAAGCAGADRSRVAFTGSVLGEIAQVRRSMETHLRVLTPEVEIAETAVEPLEGALWRARKAGVRD
jgi:N-acetylglucosamine kinase-like BadF-type ATPase